MKKSFIAASVIVILGAAYTGASWYTGNQIENKIDEKITQIVEKVNRQQNDYKVNIEYSDYQKGIFSTSLRLKIEAKQNSIFSVLNEDSSDDLVFNDVIKIYHGPFPWSQVRSGSFAPKMAAFLYESPKELNEELWVAAGNQPFLTINSTVDYSENISLLAKNPPISQLNEQKDFSFKLGQNELSIFADKYFNQFSIDINISKLHLIDKSKELQVNNFTYQGNANYQPNGQFYQIDSKIKFDKVILDSLFNRIEFNGLLLDSNDKIKQNNIIDGQTEASISSIILDKQNLGGSELNVTYNFPSKEFFTRQSYLSNSLDNETFTIDLNNFVWHTNQGDLNAKIAFKVNGNLFDTNRLDEDNLAFAKANIKLPLNTLAYLSAQVNNSNNETIDEQDVREAKQSIIMLSQLFLMNSPLLDFNYNAQDESQNGFTVDFYYNRDENRARISDRELSPQEFWRIVNLK